MNLKQRMREIIYKALNDLGIEFNLFDVMVEVPKNRENGDFSSNIAMQLTKVLKDNPRNIAEKIVDKIKDTVDIIFIDFHAEATAEKLALGYLLDGKVTAVFGTHTHVQTADERIMKNGTAYITDIGMTGPYNSVIGMDTQASIKRFETTLPEKYKLAEGECILNAVIFNIDDTTSKVTDIKRIYIR